MNINTIIETRGADLQVGMRRRWNEGSSTIMAIKPLSRTKILVSYRSDAPRPDGRHNTVSLTYSKDDFFPIITE